MLKQKYEKEVVPALIEKFGYKNKMAVPWIEKVVVNTGFGKKVEEMTGRDREKWISFIQEELALITGQKPNPTTARQSISGFDLQQGDIIGAKVTLRGAKMINFLDRLIHIALPRSRDFRGIDRKSIDKAGNLTIGLEDHTIFPEVDIETLKESFGLEVTIKTNTKDREKALTLFELLGLPLKD